MNNRCNFVRNAISAAHSTRVLALFALALLLASAAHSQNKPGGVFVVS